MFIPTLQELASRATSIQAGYGWHMRDGGYMMGGSWGAWSLIHSIFWVLFLVAILVLAVVVSRSLKDKRRGDDSGSEPSALEQLDARYARGEIDRDEYLQRKKDIMDR